MNTGTNLKTQWASAALLAALAGLAGAPALAQDSGEWTSVRGAADLRALLSNRTFKSGWGAVSHFRDDGKGLVVYSSGLRVRRTWEVRGEDKVCATSEKGETECWRVWRSRKRANLVEFGGPGGMRVAQTMEDGVPKF